MRLGLETPPLVPDIRDLSANHRAALALAQAARLIRVNGGWRAPGTKLVTVNTARILCAKQFAREEYSSGQKVLAITARGRVALAEIERRKR